MGTKKINDNNLLQTLVRFYVKERMTQRVGPRVLKYFENYFQKLGLATCVPGWNLTLL